MGNQSIHKLNLPGNLLIEFDEASLLMQQPFKAIFEFEIRKNSPTKECIAITYECCYFPGNISEQFAFQMEMEQNSWKFRFECNDSYDLNRSKTLDRHSSTI